MMVTPTLNPQQLTRMATDLRLACMRISRRIRYESSHDVAPHQFSVLCRLEEAPRTPGELAEIERVAKPSMTRTVGALVDRGLVLREDDPLDGRSVILSLSEDGRRSVKAIRRKRDAWMASRVARLTREEQDVLARATEILAKVAGE